MDSPAQPLVDLINQRRAAVQRLEGIINEGIAAENLNRSCLMWVVPLSLSAVRGLEFGIVAKDLFTGRTEEHDRRSDRRP